MGVISQGYNGLNILIGPRYFRILGLKYMPHPRGVKWVAESPVSHNPEG
ncbi:hypothetical protein Mithridates_00014 [Acinetobacter phage Mithridates]|nr:hypothetical protein Mithridates_00014 [Acinetobacter phage Mithridates]